MLIRIVRMTFRPEEIENFLQVFEETKERIRGFDGCQHLELWQDYDNPAIMLTHSHWVDDEALNAYRHSELFRSTWARTKPLFAEKPVAFSSRLLQKVKPVT